LHATPQATNVTEATSHSWGRAACEAPRADRTLLAARALLSGNTNTSGTRRTVGGSLELYELEEIRRLHEAEVSALNDTGDKERVHNALRQVAQLLEALETTIIERDAARAAGVEVVRTIRTTPPPPELGLRV
jgi:hypothetical protein